MMLSTCEFGSNLIERVAAKLTLKSYIAAAPFGIAATCLVSHAETSAPRDSKTSKFERHVHTGTPCSLHSARNFTCAGV